MKKKSILWLFKPLESIGTLVFPFSDSQSWTQIVPNRTECFCAVLQRFCRLVAEPSAGMWTSKSSVDVWETVLLANSDDSNSFQLLLALDHSIIRLSALRLCLVHSQSWSENIMCQNTVIVIFFPRFSVAALNLSALLTGKQNSCSARKLRMIQPYL